MTRARADKFPRYFPMFAALLLIAALVTGCATTPPSAMNVSVSPDGAVMLGVEPVVLKKLPAKLKSRGATQNTAIYVAVPENSSPALLRDLSETLVAAGYPRIIFTKPQKAIADTADSTVPSHR